MTIKVKLKDLLGSDKAISALSLNPWCVNEGANGDEYMEVELADAKKWGVIP